MNDIPPLLIRADAGGELGTGHVMRMIALAEGYLRRGGKAILATATCPWGLIERIESRGIVHRVIVTDKPGSAEDVDLTIKLASEINARWLVVDGYHFGYSYQKSIKYSELMLLCTDDHGYSEQWCCDAILNHNLDAEKWGKYTNDVKEDQLFLGSQFCLLRREFLESPTAVDGWVRIERLLVTLGGSDHANATEAILSYLNATIRRKLHIRVLLGADYPHIESLGGLQSQHDIELVRNATNMSDQFAWADGIISAGGSTCWEWLHAGLPGAIVTIADNQIPIVKAIAEKHRAALSLGWFNKLDPERQENDFSAWLNDPESMVDRETAHALIDGYGAERLAARLQGSPFWLREANICDTKRYFELVNDEMVRRNSFTSDLVEWNSHKDWFARKLASKDSHLFAAFNFSGDFVGQVRFDLVSKSMPYWNIDYSLMPSHRGKGLGLRLMSDAMGMLLALAPEVTFFKARVKEGNAASVKIFMDLGFQKEALDPAGKMLQYSYAALK